MRLRRSTVSVPVEGGGHVALTVVGGWVRLRYVTLLAGSSPVLRRLTTRRALLRFAEALDRGAPARLGALLVVPVPGPVPRGVLSWHGGSGSGLVWLASLSSAARGAAT